MKPIFRIQHQRPNSKFFFFLIHELTILCCPYFILIQMRCFTIPHFRILNRQHLIDFFPAVAEYRYFHFILRADFSFIINFNMQINSFLPITSILDFCLYFKICCSMIDVVCFYLRAVSREKNRIPCQQFYISVNTASRIPSAIGCNIISNHPDFIFLPIFQEIIQCYIKIRISIRMMRCQLSIHIDK